MLPLPGPTPLLQNVIGVFDGGSIINIDYFKIHPMN
jgi:hypothetical protein